MNYLPLSPMSQKIIEEDFLPAARTVAQAGWAAEDTIEMLKHSDKPNVVAFRRLLEATVALRDAYKDAIGIVFVDPTFGEPK